MLSEERKTKALKAEEGARPKYHKGQAGKKYDYYTCGNCGAQLVYAVVENYCHNCGYRQNWDSTRCLTKYRENNHGDQ